jgi:hypothetical protein
LVGLDFNRFRWKPVSNNAKWLLGIHVIASGLATHNHADVLYVQIAHTWQLAGLEHTAVIMQTVPVRYRLVMEPVQVCCTDFANVLAVFIRVKRVKPVVFYSKVIATPIYNWYLKNTSL